jgi:hypothetical protein
MIINFFFVTFACLDYDANLNFKFNLYGPVENSKFGLQILFTS